MDQDTFNKHAHEMVDWMSDYLSNIEQYPVRSQVKPGEIAGQLPVSAPLLGESMDQIFADFKKTIIPGITHWQHPNWFSFFPANSSNPSVLAEMLTATMGAQCMLWETSPAATELEIRVLDWLRQMIALPAGFHGVIQDTASSATFCAILAARERVMDNNCKEKGLFGQKPMRVYASAEAHSSIDKAVIMAGIGLDNLVRVPVDEDRAMKVDTLVRLIKEDRAKGYVPTCVIGVLGGTSVGAVDPLSDIGVVAQKEGLYYHIDAAWAGTALILPEYQYLMAGAENIDSFVFNPHKWMLTNFDCTAHFVKDSRSLTNALSIQPAYLKTREGGQVTDFRDWGVQLGRRFRALKLWFVIRSYGLAGLQHFVRQHIAWAIELAEAISKAPHFEVVTQPSFSLLSFRYAPKGVEGQALSDLNDKLIQTINDKGKTYLTRTVVDGEVVIRFSIGSQKTERHHVFDTWDHIKEVASSL